MPGNYTKQEYLLLISCADSMEDLNLLEEALKEDRESGKVDVMGYIEVKAAMLLKLTDITLAEARKKMEG